jgi:hypothetical protein
MKRRDVLCAMLIPLVAATAGCGKGSSEPGKSVQRNPEEMRPPFGYQDPKKKQNGAPRK